MIVEKEIAGYLWKPKTLKKSYLSFSQRIADGSVPFCRHSHNHEDCSIFNHAFEGMPKVWVTYFKPMGLHFQKVSHQSLLNQHVQYEETVPNGQTKKQWKISSKSLAIFPFMWNNKWIFDELIVLEVFTKTFLDALSKTLHFILRIKPYAQSRWFNIYYKKAIVIYILKNYNFKLLVVKMKLKWKSHLINNLSKVLDEGDSLSTKTAKKFPAKPIIPTTVMATPSTQNLKSKDFVILNHIKSLKYLYSTNWVKLIEAASFYWNWAWTKYYYGCHIERLQTSNT